MNPVLSICIANYEGEAVISRCLDAVLTQDCDFSFEVIVNDDASEDASCAIILENYPQVRLLRSDINCGYCKSNNRMVEEARGDFLLLLNNDTRLHDGSLQLLVDAARSQQEAGILSLPQYSMETGELLDRGLVLDFFANPIPVLHPSSEVAMVMGSCLLLRRSLWHRIGGFPEWFGSIAEDLYLCCRVRLMGLAICVTETGGYDHAVGHSFGGGKVTGNRLSSSYLRRRLSELNKNRVIATCFPGWLPYVVFPLHFPLLLIEGAVMSIAQRSQQPLQTIYGPAISGILGDLRRLQRERQRCMEHRRTSVRRFLGPIRASHRKLALLLRHGFPKLS